MPVPMIPSFDIDKRFNDKFSLTPLTICQKLGRFIDLCPVARKAAVVVDHSDSRTSLKQRRGERRPLQSDDFSRHFGLSELTCLSDASSLSPTFLQINFVLVKLVSVKYAMIYFVGFS